MIPYLYEIFCRGILTIILLGFCYLVGIPVLIAVCLVFLAAIAAAFVILICGIIIGLVDLCWKFSYEMFCTIDGRW
jgi:uncharacterized membrane protein